jgi:diacylglycerol kinase
MWWPIIILTVLLIVFFFIVEAAGIAWALLTWPIFLIVAYYGIEYILKKMNYLD